jgi:hypothetical protein
MPTHKCLICGAPPVNVTHDLCEIHLENRVERQKRYDERMRAKFRFYILDGTHVGDGESGRQTAFEVFGVQSNSAAEFLETCTVSEIDKDGGELNTLAFEEAPKVVRETILKLCGLTQAELDRTFTAEKPNERGNG